MLTLVSTLALAATAMASSSDSPEHKLVMKNKITRWGRVIIEGFEWEYSVVNGLWISGGDIVIGTDKDGVTVFKKASSSSSSSSSSNRRRLSPYLVSAQSRWKSGIVPYVIDGSLCKSSRFMTVFKDVVGRFASKTGIRLVPTPNTNTNYDHLRFFLGSGCWSYVGNIGGSRRQDVSIGNGCAHVGVVIHEILHAIGFMHTQTREDRDKYVTINFANIQKGREGNFKKANVNQFDDCLRYDYSSVMHYGSHAFSSNGKPTIVAKQSGVKLGQRGGFSNLDVACVKKIYPGLRVPATPAAVKCNGGGSPIAQPTKRPPTRRPVTKPTRRPVTKPTRPTGGCTDRYTSCPAWKSRGYCASNSRYYRFMIANCKKSCNKCSVKTTTKAPTCKDRQTSRNCNYWKGRKFCAKSSRYYNYMKANCKKTCNLCGVSALAEENIMPPPQAAYEIDTPFDIPPETDANNMQNFIGKEIFGLQTAVVVLVVAVTLLVMYICTLKFKMKNQKKPIKYSEVSISSDASESESETPLKKYVDN